MRCIGVKGSMDDFKTRSPIIVISTKTLGHDCLEEIIINSSRNEFLDYETISSHVQVYRFDTIGWIL